MILLTGARGFIGRSLLRRLRALELETVALHRGPEVMVQGNTWECDLTQQDHLNYLLSGASVPETVIHLAGHVEISLVSDETNPRGAPIPGYEDIQKIYLGNVLATANLLAYCLRARVRRLIFASSQAVYGMPRSLPLTEETPCEPLEHYAASKLGCEEILKVGSRQGLNVTVMRIPGLFSEQRHSGVVFQFAHQAVTEKHIRVNAVLPLPIDTLHLDDATEAFISALAYDQPGWSCFNIGTGLPCSLNLMADEIGALAACEVTHAQVVQPVVALDVSRANRLLGWKAAPRQDRWCAMLREIGNVN
jgi:nucleoside-diphosphate-sugar epimerase